MKSLRRHLPRWSVKAAFALALLAWLIYAISNNQQALDLPWFIVTGTIALVSTYLIIAPKLLPIANTPTEYREAYRAFFNHLFGSTPLTLVREGKVVATTHALSSPDHKPGKRIESHRPGVIVTDSTSVLVLRAKTGVSRVVGSGTERDQSPSGVIFTLPGEEIDTIIDLRPQLRLIFPTEPVQMTTLDGIPINVRVLAFFTLKGTKARRMCDLAREPMRWSPPFTWRKASILQAISTRRIQRKDGKDERTAWSDQVLAVSIPRLRQLIARYTIDDLTAPLTALRHPRFDIRDELVYSVRQQLSAFDEYHRETGIDVRFMAVPIMFPPKQIIQQRIDLWKNEWRKRGAGSQRTAEGSDHARTASPRRLDDSQTAARNADVRSSEYFYRDDQLISRRRAIADYVVHHPRPIARLRMAFFGLALLALGLIGVRQAPIIAATRDQLQPTLSAVLNYGLSFAYYLLPAVMAIAFVLWRATDFMNKLFGLKPPATSMRHVMSMMFGIGSNGVFVKQGKIEHNPTNTAAEIIGGPAWLTVSDYSAVVLERGGGFSRVVGPGITSMLSHERVRGAVDLQAQHRTVTEKTLSKDGLPIQVDVDMVFRITPKDLPADVPPVLLEASRAHHFSREAVRRAIYETAVLSPNIIPDWSNSFASIRAGDISDQLAELRYDEVNAPNDPNRHPLRDIMAKGLEDARYIGALLGIEMIDMTMGLVELQKEYQDDVTMRLFSNWKAEWDRRSTVRDVQDKNTSSAKSDKGQAAQHDKTDTVPIARKSTNTKTSRQAKPRPTIGIITALPQEFVPVERILDNPRQEYVAPGKGAGRRYRLGDIPALNGGVHLVALTLLTDMGNNSAAYRAALLPQHFPTVRAIVMAGIAGGIPYPQKPDEHVRLGDVVVSDRLGVVQYDFDTETITETIHRYPPRPPSATLLEGVKYLQVSERKGNRPWLKWIDQISFDTNVSRPSEETDILVSAEDSNTRISHPLDSKRVPDQPRIFYGPIASANKLLKNPLKRDELRNRFGAKAVEMEGSGIADATWSHEMGYLVVRGICDYCDANKGDAWQEYAAVVAAAYARALLESIPS